MILSYYGTKEFGVKLKTEIQRRPFQFLYRSLEYSPYGVMIIISICSRGLQQVLMYFKTWSTQSLPQIKQ